MAKIKNIRILLYEIKGNIANNEIVTSLEIFESKSQRDLFLQSYLVGYLHIYKKIPLCSVANHLDVLGKNG